MSLLWSFVPVFLTAVQLIYRIKALSTGQRRKEFSYKITIQRLLTGGPDGPGGPLLSWEQVHA